MATPRERKPTRLSFEISTRQRPEFQQPLAVYLFNERGDLIDQVDVREGKVELPLLSTELGRKQVFIAPVSEAFAQKKPTPADLERLGAYQPVLQVGERFLERIDIPGSLLQYWPFCSCWVRGRVVRQSDNRAVCGARVHICEVDRVPWIIAKLVDSDLLRLRDDLLEVLDYPPVPWPGPGPGPDPGPFARRAGTAVLEPSSRSRSVLRFVTDPGSAVGFNPQPEPPGAAVSLNPQPLPPGAAVSLNPQPLPPGAAVSLNPQPLPPRESLRLSAELETALRSRSTLLVRNTLIQNWKLVIPWLCLWPHWWEHLRCDEVAVLLTDGTGRFETNLFYRCGGDHPDLYFWVEYDFGGGFETVYRPRIACHTYWDYVCGSLVVLRVTDPRVPGCDEEPDLPGCQVVVLSIGRNIAVRQVQTSGAEGVTVAGQPFGATLEPRVDFSRTELIVNKGIPYYRWSYRRLSGPDGVALSVDPSSVPLGAWAVMNRDVFRHYKIGTSYPSDLMGPMPTAGPGAAPAPNLFRIRPLLPPAGTEWIVLNETIDLATAYFDTGSLAGVPAGGPPWPDDLAAGRYELKLELFDAAGALVNWTAAGIDLRITDQDAPFGTGVITTVTAPTYNRILVGGNTMGFRMVVRVDNNRCSADILPLGGTVTPDPVCGFHNYSTPSDVAAVSFVARHPNHFAGYSFVTTRGPGPTIPVASTSGTAGEAGTNGFTEVADFTYSKGIVVSALLGACSNAAFSERLDVMAMATNGYGTLTGYNAADNAAFALAAPCPACR